MELCVGFCGRGNLAHSLRFEVAQVSDLRLSPVDTGGSMSASVGFVPDNATGTGHKARPT